MILCPYAATSAPSTDATASTFTAAAAAALCCLTPARLPPPSSNAGAINAALGAVEAATAAVPSAWSEEEEPLQSSMLRYGRPPRGSSTLKVSAVFQRVYFVKKEKKYFLFSRVGSKITFKRREASRIDIKFYMVSFSFLGVCDFDLYVFYLL